MMAHEEGEMCIFIVDSYCCTAEAKIEFHQLSPIPHLEIDHSEYM